MEDHFETCRIIKRDYPGYDNMSPKNALDLYFKIYNNLHNKQTKLWDIISLGKKI